ncbi:MAG: DUF2939 domain-containing protein [Gammaproteobacteria bacterium]|nr:DUF2939 domain-containing protein [Gammaproteobacteria bacterium]
MKTLIFGLIILFSAFLAWPYTAVYRLDQALVRNDTQAIEQLIDIESIQQQIKRKMNKNVESSIGDVSNSFVEWLQNGIQRLGNDAIDSLVNLDWVMAQLRSKNPDNRRGGFFEHLSYAFFDGHDGLLLRIGELDDDPVHARLTLQETQWRITAIYN